MTEHEHDELRTELVAFQLGITERRDAIEAHLRRCAGCLDAFLAIKRSVETGEGGPRPSDAVRARVRASVAAALGVGRRRWWERPVAFAFAASIVLASMVAMRALTAGPGAPPVAVSAPSRG